MSVAMHVCAWWTIFAGAVNIIHAFSREPDRWSLFYVLAGLGLLWAGILA